jgi:hypothetical protein
MREDELLPPPVEDTIALLVKAARRAGFDVEPDPERAVAIEPRAHGSLRRHLRAMVTEPWCRLCP